MEGPTRIDVAQPVRPERNVAGRGRRVAPCPGIPGDQNALIPVSSRPTTNWCTVSVPSYVITDSRLSA